jgi:hypothetical protein
MLANVTDVVAAALDHASLLETHIREAVQLCRIGVLDEARAQALNHCLDLANRCVQDLASLH